MTNAGLREKPDAGSARKVQGLLCFLAVGFALLAGTCLGGNEFKLMSYNVRILVSPNTGHDITSNVVDVITSERPRFVALQEIYHGGEKYGDQVAKLAQLTGMVGTSCGGPSETSFYGIALLSDVAPLSTRCVALPGTEKRALLIAEFEDCYACCTHLSNTRESERLESVPLIRDAIKDLNKPVFVSGDWNGTPDTDTFDAMREIVTVLSPTDQATFHDGDWCLDYVSVRNADAVKFSVIDRSRVDDSKYKMERSDHYPIVVTVQRR